MRSLPQEIIGDILSRLPVKPLLRFRCVSKPWCSLIDSKDFIKLHLHQSMKTNSFRFLLVEDTDSDLFSVDFDSFKRLEFGELPVTYHSVENSAMDLFSWCPTVLYCGKHKILPPTKLDFSAEFEVYVNELYGFGYDSKSDDYKVVKVTEVGDGRDGEYLFSQTKIYSLKSNSWKRVEDFPHILPSGKRVWGVYLNDALHTVVKHCHHYESIMAFDLGTAEHHEVPKPDLVGESTGVVSVEEMGGYLTALVGRKMNRSEIWVMKEYGVKESWTILLCFSPPIPEPYSYLTPLAFSKKGDEVFLNYDGRCLLSYNLRKKASRIVNVPELVPQLYGIVYSGSRFYAEDCVGSLVSLDSPDETHEQEKQNMKRKKKDKKVTKKRDDFLSKGFKLVP